MRRTTLWGLAVLLVAFVAGTAVATNGPRPVDFTFTGRLQVDPGTGATSLPVAVTTGNRQALQKLVGQSRNRTFAVDADTEFLLWGHGKPTVVTLDALSAGDLVTVHVVAQRDTPLVQLETTPANVVADRGQNPGKPHRALWLFRGTLNSATTSSVSIHVFDGNHRALRSMLGASVDQTFAFDVKTVFLSWQGRVPSVIAPAVLQAGDRITVRVRAARGSTLTQVEATAAARIAQHEPSSPES
jgi:hypothetical protein